MMSKKIWKKDKNENRLAQRCKAQAQIADSEIRAAKVQYLISKVVAENALTWKVLAKS